MKIILKVSLQSIRDPKDDDVEVVRIPKLLLLRTETIGYTVPVDHLLSKTMKTNFKQAVASSTILI